MNKTRGEELRDNEGKGVNAERAIKEEWRRRGTIKESGSSLWIEAD